MPEIDNPWFASWFNTKYYHILYKDRDYDEAQLFIDNMTQYLNLPENGSVLDLACGRGRHSIYLNSLGYDVVGADLSENSIAYAKEFENDHLHFEVHDMRKPFHQTFDAVMNLFTSFGYFEQDSDNLAALSSIQNSLNEYGLAVMDFMNVHKVIHHLVESEVKTVKNIDFHIKRWYDGSYIYKNIQFTDEGQSFNFEEKVKALTLTDFENLMEEAGIHLLETFGDYKLNRFHPENSDRLIMVFK